MTIVLYFVCIIKIHFHLTIIFIKGFRETVPCNAIHKDRFHSQSKRNYIKNSAMPATMKAGL